MMKTDKGLKKAAENRPTFKLPSNFTYRMMQQVNQYAYLHEKKQERRTFLAIWIIAITLGTGTAIVLGRLYKEQLADFFNRLHDCSTIIFWLPAVIAAFLLLIFNFWLQKNIRQRLLK